ncbi:MAG TPA: nuclear transport factor 2 family protein [Terrimicrobiaceae bacterium]|nr:nuclear transport factor 2 family protein [Terrimicrobiaceae bacterium]
MRIRFLLTLVGLTSGVALQGIAQWKDTADPEAARQLVSFYDSALSMKYEKAFNEKNAEALASLFTESALLVAPEGLFSGRAAIEKRYAGVFQRSNLTDFFGMRSQLNAIGDELCAVGSWRSLLQTERGPLQVGGHWLEIYAREADGWKIRVSIFNVSPSQDLSPQQPILAASDL